jgi:hypothetical protein
MNPYRLVSRRLNFFERLIGASYSELFLVWLLLNVAFTAAYFLLSIYAPEHGPTLPLHIDFWTRLFDSFYFSVVTATSTGYGDILPQGFSKVLSMSQCIMALLVFAVLVGKLVSQRQDTTLHEVHRMTFEGIFYHIRHVLFIVRKDFDSVIHKAETNKKLEEHDWDNLTTAYLQAQSLIEEIPDLYNSHGYDLHNIDMNRERLLFEALHRTLQRVHTLLNVLDQHRIDWKSHAASMSQLKTMVDTVDAVTPLWRERSPYHEEKEFEEIHEMTESLHKQLKERMKKS